MVAEPFYVPLRPGQRPSFTAAICHYRRPPEGGWESWGKRLDKGSHRRQPDPGEVVEMRLITIKGHWVPHQVLDALEHRTEGWDPGYWSTPWEVRSFLSKHGRDVHSGGPIAALGSIQRDAKGRPIASSYAPRNSDGYYLWPVRADALFHGSFRFLMTVL